ncbi:MAG TPA: biopolymer transporter ExbD [Flavilitoribacter sp.]|nr:biopolymer transporter ExbD [Flavilitoribacter sp.]HMQ86032.1 biopolymer transporter ExbD [Flavilitoribacter sp.]
MQHSKPRRFDNAINASSMADIAFLLLIFFLVTTKIVEEQGVFVKLPPWDPTQQPVDLNENNVLSIKVNALNQLMIEGQISDFSNLRSRVKSFIMEPVREPDEAVVSLQNDRGTHYQTYVLAYNEIKAAYSELWDAWAEQHFGRPYDELTSADQKTVRDKIPLVISEAEPTEIGEQKQD